MIGLIYNIYNEQPNYIQLYVVSCRHNAYRDHNSYPFCGVLNNIDDWVNSCVPTVAYV